MITVYFIGLVEMFKKILEGPNKKVDGTCFVYPDGTESNSELHEQMVAGVDDTELRKVSAKMLIETGMDEEVAKRVMGLG